MIALLRRAPLTLIVAGALVAPVAGQTDGEILEALRTGAYESAIDLLRDRLDAAPNDDAVRARLVRAYTTVGSYANAIRVGQERASSGAVALETGRALRAVGRWDEAEEAFATSSRAGGSTALTGEVERLELAFARGRIEEALDGFDRFIDVYNSADGRLSAADLVAVGRAVRRLGRRDASLFQDALRAFDEAAARDPDSPEPRIRAGDLFLEKYDSQSAKAEFERVLEVNPRHPEALLGLARSLVFDGVGDAGTVLARVFEVNEAHVDARATLALRHLANEGIEAGFREARAALEVNPNSLTALTALAGAQMLAEDRAAYEETRTRVLALNPRYAPMDVQLAEVMVQVRRYREAVERARSAVELDSAHWEGWGVLGINRLRLGDIEEGRADVERAFAGDPFNPWFKNTLDLLDTFERFDVHTTPHFRLALHGTESELLATYLEPLAEEAFDRMAELYQGEPEAPVRAELFPSHADFSVRTLGETGLGALGVSFGPVLVMDSPGARTRGEYNWASVFWHELAHTFHLSLSDHRVPRWFSEGLAVHEQRRARAGWGPGVSFAFLQAFQDGRLEKVSTLNDGFMRPDEPRQVGFSYYQASLVFEMIEQRHGFDAVRRMLDGYRRGEDTESLVESLLGMSMDTLDEDFDSYLRAKYATALTGLVSTSEPPPPGAPTPDLERFVRAHPGDLLGRLRLAATLYREERFDDAEPHFREALRIFPEYGGPDAPYWFLAKIHERRGETEQAASALRRLTERSESNYDALLLLADLEEELGRTAASAEALEQAVHVWPYERAVHERLADLYATTAEFEGAVRERRAVVALDPPDRAEALYRLALAERAAGDATAARRSVMLALDIAPNYEEALELLLALRSGGVRP